MEGFNYACIVISGIAISCMTCLHGLRDCFCYFLSLKIKKLNRKLELTW